MFSIEQIDISEPIEVYRNHPNAIDILNELYRQQSWVLIEKNVNILLEIAQSDLNEEEKFIQSSLPLVKVHSYLFTACENSDLGLPVSREKRKQINQDNRIYFITMIDLYIKKLVESFNKVSNFNDLYNYCNIYSYFSQRVSNFFCYYENQCTGISLHSNIKSLSNITKDNFEIFTNLNYDFIFEASLNIFTDFSISNAKNWFIILNCLSKHNQEVYKKLLKNIENQFKEYYLNILNQGNFTRYFDSVYKIISTEENRLDYLHNKNLLNFIIQIFIFDFIQLLREQFEYAIDYCNFETEIEYRKKLYYLINFVSDKKDFKEIFIKMCHTSFDDVDFDELINRFTKIENSVDKNFKYLLNLEFKKIINLRNNFARDFVNFLNFRFSKKIEETLESLDTYMKILSLYSSKDLFKNHYQIKLAERLLAEKSCLYSETSFISKLTINFGSYFTRSLSVMIKDKNLQKDLLKDFKNTNSIIFNPIVLDGFSWPSFESFSTGSIRLPEELNQSLIAFENYYSKKFKSKSLRWSLNCDKITLKYLSKELIMNTIQASVCLLFNQTEQLTIDQIITELGISKLEAVRAVTGLSHQKSNVLKYKDNLVTLNSNFRNERNKINIPNPKISSMRKEVDQNINSSRGYVLDSIIVRIMKSEKQITHKDLMTKIIEHFSKDIFQPEISLIKARIESLLEREFISRDHDFRDLYHYIS